MNKPNLVIHGSESDQVERNQLSLVTMPEATRSYCPVRHDTFVDLVEDKLADVGFRFGDQVHHLTRDGKRHFGLAHLLNGSNNEQHALILGMRNSLDKAFAATIMFGAQVFICDNLQISAERVVGRKHTTNIMRDLPSLVVEAVSHTKLLQEVQDTRFEHYQSFKLSDTQADRIMIEMVRIDAVNTSRIGKVIQEWYEPTAVDAKDRLIDHGPKRAWRLLNAATEALKGAPIHDIPHRTMRVQNILDEVSGFDPDFHQQRLVA